MEDTEIDALVETPDSDVVEEVASSSTSNTEVASKTPEKENKATERVRLLKLPLARVKNIMKLDPDCHLISQESVFLATKAAELFIEMLSREVIVVTNQSKRKTVLKRDLELVIKNSSNLCFLDGMMEA